MKWLHNLFSKKEDKSIIWEMNQLYWRHANIVTPPQDQEVIVLLDDIHCGSNYKIAFGHIVDKTRCIDYNGWNIPNVVCWMPCPQIPYEKEE